MEDRPRRKGRAKADPPENGKPHLGIWVPPGVRPVVSRGVAVNHMGGKGEKPPRRPDGDRSAHEGKARPEAGNLTWSRWVKEILAGKGASDVLPPAPGGLRHRPAVWPGPGGGQAWEPEAPEAMAVTPEMEAQAHAAMAHWKMKVSDMTVMATKPEKGGAIWRIETDKGPRSLKLLHRPPARSLFSIGLQEYLVQQGARVPKLIPARNGQSYVELEGRLWIVTDWIEGLVPAGKDLEGAQALCYGLGEFHRKSQGYVPPPGAVVASRLHRWPNTYQKVLTKMGWFREVATAYPDAPASASVLALVDRFEEQARRALQRLEASPYRSLADRGGPAWGVVHQDYGWSNGQLGPGGVWIIDLDGVAYDLPIRDLRKLITSTMDDMGTWDPAWMRGMIDAYRQANPIEPDLYRVLLIDMSLPNEFYKHVKDMLTDPLAFLSPDLDLLLQRLAETDKTKWEALRELGLDAPPGAAASARRKRGDGP